MSAKRYKICPRCSKLLRRDDDASSGMYPFMRDVWVHDETGWMNCAPKRKALPVGWWEQIGPHRCFVTPSMPTDVIGLLVREVTMLEDGSAIIGGVRYNIINKPPTAVVG